MSGGGGEPQVGSQLLALSLSKGGSLSCTRPSAGQGSVFAGFCLVVTLTLPVAHCLYFSNVAVCIKERTALRDLWLRCDTQANHWALLSWAVVVVVVLLQLGLPAGVCASENKW